jgi:hypothetical protein
MAQPSVVPSACCGPFPGTILKKKNLKSTTLFPTASPRGGALTHLPSVSYQKEACLLFSGILSRPERLIACFPTRKGCSNTNNRWCGERLLASIQEEMA